MHYALPVPDDCFVCESPVGSPKPKLLDRVRHEIRLRQYSRRTEKSYVARIRRFIVFHGKRHPVEMGEAEVTRFLTHLAVAGKVSSSTQNQALSALVFLYRAVLGVGLDWLDGVVRAKDLRDGKGRKDRVTMLPARLVEPLSRHLDRVRRQHEDENGNGSLHPADAADRRTSGGRGTRPPRAHCCTICGRESRKRQS